MSQSAIAIDSYTHKAFSETYLEPAVGLVIGARTENGKEFYVAHFAETLEDISDPSDENKSESSDSPPLTKKTDIHSVREQTVAFHGKQVLRMLPGGLSILGIFIVEKEKNIFMRGKLEMKIKSVLNYLAKSIVQNSWYDAKFESSNEMLVIHYEPSAKIFTARNIDVNGPGQGKVSELKLQPRNLKWEKLECEFDTVGAMHVYKQAVGIPIKKNLQSLMKAFQESLNKAKILVGGRFPSSNIIYQERDYIRRGGSESPEPENNISDLEDEYFGYGDDDDDDNLENTDSAFDSSNKSTGKGRTTRSKSGGGGGDNNDDISPEDIAVSSMSMSSSSKSGKKKATTTGSTSSMPSTNGASATSPVCILFEKMPGILRSETPTPTSEYEEDERGNGGSGRSSSSSMRSRKRENSPESHEFIHHLHLQGKICVVAYVPEGSSTELAAMSLRRDITRSMASRIEMHCESLIDEEQTDESLQVYHEMPRRVFYQIPSSNIMVSDYLFPGEVAQDSIFSLQDLLSLQIQDVKDILDQKELPIGDSERSGLKGSVEELLHQAENASKFNVQGLDMRTKVILFLLFIVLVTILAVVVPFFVGRSTLPLNQKNAKSDL